MAVNDKQKIIVLDINASTQATVEQKLLDGFVIQFIVNLQPAQNKLLIVYATPDTI
jgi:hypothetical protein